MKKLLGIVVLGLLLCNIGFAACVEGNCKSGEGTYTWPDGRKYVGEFKNSKGHGEGTYTWPDGEKYTGGHKNGKSHGYGTYTWTNGNKYTGGYKNGKRHGEGTFTWVDGNKYTGEYKKGKRHGEGTLTFPDGSAEKHVYKNGKLISKKNKTKDYDIRDFQIGEISIGDSLLDYMDKSEIESKRKYFWSGAGIKKKKSEYSMILTRDKSKIDIFDALRFYFRSEDENYIIQSVAGYKFFKNNINECNLLQKEISNNVKDITGNNNFKNYNDIKIEGDGGTRDMTSFKFENNTSIKILCYDYVNYTDRLSLIIASSDFYDFQEKMR